MSDAGDRAAEPWNAIVKPQTPLDLEVVVDACRAPTGIESYLLPLLVANHREVVFEAIEELTVEYVWPTGLGHAKLVLPQLLVHARGEAVRFLKDLFRDGNLRQRKASAESFRALVYLDPEWTTAALLECLESEEETIQVEAVRALACLSEVDVWAAEEIRRVAIGYPGMLAPLKAYDLPDQSTLFQMIRMDGWIDTFRFAHSDEPPRSFLRMLGLGLPGLFSINSDIGSDRLESLQGIRDPQLPFVTAVHNWMSRSHDAGAHLRRVSSRIHDSNSHIRQVAVIDLLLLSVDGDVWALRQLEGLVGDSKNVSIVARRALSALGAD